jgi:hypothetical protein
MFFYTERTLLNNIEENKIKNCVLFFLVYCTFCKRNVLKRLVVLLKITIPIQTLYGAGSRLTGK